jgi:hypothetical protein
MKIRVSYRVCRTLFDSRSDITCTGQYACSRFVRFSHLICLVAFPLGGLVSLLVSTLIPSLSSQSIVFHRASYFDRSSFLLHPPPTIFETILCLPFDSQPPPPPRHPPPVSTRVVWSQSRHYGERGHRPPGRHGRRPPLRHCTISCCFWRWRRTDASIGRRCLTRVQSRSNARYSIRFFVRP